MHSLTVFDPSTGDLVNNQIPVGGDQDVDAAVRYANGAFASDAPWRQLSGVDRAALMFRFAKLLEDNREELARLTRLTLGAPYEAFGKAEIDTAIAQFRCRFRSQSSSTAGRNRRVLIRSRLRWMGR